MGASADIELEESMIAVTGSTGHLGRLVIRDLLEREVPAGEIVAVARNPEKAADLAAEGVQVRRGDYDQPDTLRPALEGVDMLLLISGSEVGQRVRQHRAVLDAAEGVGVSRVVYTSILNADTSGAQLAAEHKVTEEMLEASDIPHVLLRNGWYMENYTDQLPQFLEHGTVLGSAGDGRVSAATRADYAAAAVAVVMDDAEGGGRTVYELGGDEAFTMAELAEEVARQTGNEVVYRDLPEEEYTQVLVGAGIPEPYARVLADSDRAVGRGELSTDSGDLSRLIGRPTTPLKDAIAASLPGSVTRDQ